MIIGISDALLKLAPGAEWVLRGSSYEGLEWIDGHGYEKPTLTAVNNKIAELRADEPMRLLRILRNQKLAETDWKVIKAKETGTNLSSAFKAYRQALRDLPTTATPTLNESNELDMTSFTLPTEPS